MRRISRAEDWISKDIHFLRLVAHKVAYKLYRSSYNRGARLFYPPHFILLDYILKADGQELTSKQELTEKIFAERYMSDPAIAAACSRLNDETYFTAKSVRDR